MSGRIRALSEAARLRVPSRMQEDSRPYASGKVHI